MKIGKTASTGVLLVLTLVLSGCSVTAQNGGTPSSKVDFSTLKQSTRFDQHVFSNSQLGVSFKLPDCFESVPEAPTQQVVDDVKRDSRAPGAVGRTYVILNALCKQQDGNRASVTYIVEPIPEGVTPEKYARVNVDNAFPYPNATLEKEVHKEILAGRDFQSYDVMITGAEVRLRQRYFVTTYANAGTTMILMASSDELMSTLLDNVQNSYRVSR